LKDTESISDFTIKSQHLKLQKVKKGVRDIVVLEEAAAPNQKVGPVFLCQQSLKENLLKENQCQQNLSQEISPKNQSQQNLLQKIRQLGNLQKQDLYQQKVTATSLHQELVK
jgi:hypothetical protein